MRDVICRPGHGGRLQPHSCKEVAVASSRHCRKRWTLYLVGTPPWCLLVLWLVNFTGSPPNLAVGLHVLENHDGPFEAASDVVGQISRDISHDIKAKGRQIEAAVESVTHKGSIHTVPSPPGTNSGKAQEQLANTTVEEAREEQKKDGRSKLVAISVPIRRVPETGLYQVRTQMRHVIDKKYDPLYDGTYEAVGESLHSNEPITEGVWRGLEEEMGLNRSFIAQQPNQSFVVVGADDIQTTMCQAPQDPVLSLTPYVYAQALGKPQPWVGLGFAVLVPPGTPAMFKGHDDEAENARWWDSAALLDLLEKEPGKFMGFHYPVFLHICKDLSTGKLQSRLLGHGVQNVMLQNSIEAGP